MDMMTDLWRLERSGREAGKPGVTPSGPTRRPNPTKFATLPPPAEESEEWVISYMDMVTLLMVVFLGMVAILGMKGRLSAKPEGDGSPTVTRESATPVVVPALALQESAVGDEAPGTGPADAAHGGGVILTPAAQALLTQLEAAGQGANLDVILADRKLTIAIKDRILFASGRADLAPSGRRLLATVARGLGTLTGIITVEGHTDDVAISTARFPTNWELSSARASAVVRELIANGVDPARLRAVGYANTKPLDVRDRAANRRVTIVVEQ
ncbi:OmpA/MotB family protein [Nitrospirillum sp. BR 11163]|uniref:OmpA/MotB family protein n=1 Tax=Nitrospirillum sp. BR 11163 TaxID=3104323 RepID=UPI002AFEDBCA|nr:OmpA family protein [Nitrospirillum sp. BR 11163]MEA1676698.1 OmpA family protein [Nitrospirillum sp. BR 11163]